MIHRYKFVNWITHVRSSSGYRARRGPPNFNDIRQGGEIAMIRRRIKEHGSVPQRAVPTRMRFY